MPGQAARYALSVGQRIRNHAVLVGPPRADVACFLAVPSYSVVDLSVSTTTVLARSCGCMLSCYSHLLMYTSMHAGCISVM